MKRLAIAALIGVLALGPTATTSRQAAAGVSALDNTTAQVLWLRVDAYHPRTLFVSGSAFCHQSSDGIFTFCPKWLMRSTDGGSTWVDVADPVWPALYIGDQDLYPVVIAPDGRHLYLPAHQSGITPSSQGLGYYASADGGVHWQGSSGNGGDGGGISTLTVSPLSNRRVYAVNVSNGVGDQSSTVMVSDDDGSTWDWNAAGSPSPYVYRLALVPDPAHLNTVYADLMSFSDPATSFFASRSLDAGVTWTAVTTPTASPPLQTFMVSSDTVGTAIVGQTFDSSVPPDRRYLSRDEGRTWHATTCSGDLHGVCPTLIVDNVFGAGASYAFMANSIWRFQAGGPAQTRLAISTRLPVPTARILYVGAGRRQGDPVYLLAERPDSTTILFYRTSDGGHTWTQLPIGVLPSLAPASHARGTLYVPATGHSVSAPFVATYRRLGATLLGHPLTEAYWEADVLVQIFAHMRLEQRGTRIVFGHIGTELATNETVTPLPGSYAIGSDFVGFWSEHGGAHVFGEAIDRVYVHQQRGYVDEDQGFENAHLACHYPVLSHCRTVVLEAAGLDWLRARGWAAS